jgi:hypothetical protein
MLSISRLEEIQSIIEKKTNENHSDSLELCQVGINLLFDAFNILVNMDVYTSKEHYYRLAIWGYLGSMTSTLVWCLNAAHKGQYRIAMILIRVLIEEAVTAKYYSKYPEKAFEAMEQAAQDFTSRVRFEPDIYKKFKAVGISPNNSLYKFYGQVSEGFSHSTLTMLPINIDSKQRIVRVKEPDYNPETLEAITTYILQLAYMMIVTVGITFTDLQSLSPEWSKESKAFLDMVIERRESEQDKNLNEIRNIN